MSNVMNRTISREYAFKFLYFYFDKKDGHSEEISELIKNFNTTINDPDSGSKLDTFGPNYNYAISIVELALEHKKDIEEKLNAGLDNWKLEKLDRIDMAALFVGISEMMYVKNCPSPKIIIDEIISLAKKFGSAKSSSFVNGILDKIAKTEGKIK